MQEVLLKIMINLPKIESATNLAGYLVKLTNNAVTDHYRKRKPVLENGLLTEASFEDEHEKDQSLQLADCCLRPMIDMLPAIYRDALIMTELEGMKQKEYAEKMGISSSNAKMRVQRAKQKLREVILQCCTYEFDNYGNIVDCSKNEQPGCCRK
jgi:RNA polymerase sigma-70 factor (ECF subfamily)